MFSLTINQIDVEEDETLYEFTLKSKSSNCNLKLFFSGEPFTTTAEVTSEEAKIVTVNSNGPDTQISLTLIDDDLKVMYYGDPGTLIMKYTLNEDQISSFKECVSKISNLLQQETM